MIEIKQLQFFVACVEEGSFSRAAEVLYTSQPNVSKVVREMEQELGLSLFERGGRGVVPSSDGKTLYQYALEMLAKERNISNLVKSHRQDSLRICFNHSRSMAQILTDFRETKNGNIDLRVREGDTEMVLNDVEHYRSDLGMTFILDKQMPAFHYNLERRGLSMQVIRRDDVHVSVGEKNHYSRNRSIRLIDLANEPFVRHSDDFFSMENGLSMIEPALKPAMDSALMSNSVQLVINLLVESDLCNISVPTFFHTDLASGIRQAVIEPRIAANFVCIYRYQPTGITAEFMEYMRRMS